MSLPLPNLHHLELFYHVASSGGISAAVRTMPYGIQQPAVSGQIAQLEADLGVRLFQRRPFQLTPGGQELYAFCAPFFHGLAGVVDQISGTAARHLRLAAPAMVIREHLPAVLESVRKSFPDLELTLVDANQRTAIEILEREEVDLAITELEGKPPAGTHHELLLNLPVVLLLPPGCPLPKRGLSSLAQKYPLIRPPDGHFVSRALTKALSKRNIRWPAGIEVGALDLIMAYVRRGFGVGVTVPAPGIELPEGVRMYVPKGFPKLKIAALWRGKPAPLTQHTVEQLKRAAMRSQQDT